jgi:hypothetical protein
MRPWPVCLLTHSRGQCIRLRLRRAVFFVFFLLSANFSGSRLARTVELAGLLGLLNVEI